MAHKGTRAAEPKIAPTVDDLTIAEIALRAHVDRRSVRKRLRGERVRGLAGARIDRELAALALDATYGGCDAR